MNLTLAQIFGEGTSQTLTTITIQKSALQGLVPNANNHAEQIFAVIIKTALEQFEGSLTDESGNTVLSPDNSSIDYDNSALYELVTVKQWRIQFLNRKVRHNFLIFNYLTYAD